MSLSVSGYPNSTPVCIRSKKEGYYPDLIKFTEHRLAELNPKRYVCWIMELGCDNVVLMGGGGIAVSC